MKKFINNRVIATIIITFIGTFTLNAQVCTNEQKAVWQEVENMWTNWKLGDLEAAFVNLDKDWLGWNDEDPLPISKEKWVSGMKETKNMRTNIIFDIEPAKILVKENAAVVHYYFSYSFLHTNGEESTKVSDEGKWSQFFINVDGKWKVIGDFSASTSK